MSWSSGAGAEPRKILTFSMLKRSFLCILRLFLPEFMTPKVSIQFSFWKIRGISELGSNRLPATENAS